MLEKSLQDLEKSNPALAYIVKNPQGWPKEDKRLTQKRKAYLVSRKQREIAQYFGFEAGDEKLLRKVSTLCLSKSILTFLHKVWKKPEIKERFRSVSKITPYLIAFVSFAIEDGTLDQMTPKLWKELGSDKGDLEPIRLNDNANITGDKTLKNYPRILYLDWRDITRFAPNWKIKSLEAIASKHLEMVRISQNLLPSINFRYPKHPFSERDFFKQIKTSHQLCKEGRRLNNCIYTYDRLAEKGDCFLFLMNHPQDCHFGIEQWWNEETQEYKFNLLDFRSHNNQSPSNEAWDTLLLWCKENKIFGDRNTVNNLPDDAIDLVNLEEMDLEEIFID